jgi:hypothetical protein
MNKPLWTFEGYVSDSGNRIVQDWFDDELDEDGRDAVRDRIRYLGFVDRHQWKEPHFKHFKSDFGEIRKKTPEGGLRIYGHFRGPRTFMFLNGVLKKTNDDKRGKRTAESRFKQFKQGKGGYHEFEC